jgi:hypothetical protein
MTSLHSRCGELGQLQIHSARRPTRLATGKGPSLRPERVLS